jgi:hypothetical protein
MLLDTEGTPPYASSCSGYGQIGIAWDKAEIGVRELVQIVDQRAIIAVSQVPLLQDNESRCDKGLAAGIFSPKLSECIVSFSDADCIDALV